jgi:hypothetical protein
MQRGKSLTFVLSDAMSDNVLGDLSQDCERLKFII